MWPLFRRAAISFWQLTFLERSKNVVNTAMKWICVDCMNSKEFLVSFSRLSVRHQFMFHYQENSNEMQFVAVGWPLFIRFNSIAQVSESECQCNAAKWSFIKKTRNHYPLCFALMDTVFCRVVEDFVSTFPSFSFFFYTSLTSAGVYRLSAAVGDLVVVVESEVSGAPFPNETTAAVCQSAADFGIWNPKKKIK